MPAASRSRSLSSAATSRPGRARAAIRSAASATSNRSGGPWTSSVNRVVGSIYRLACPFMATATPSPTPNPNAMKYDLDVKLPATLNVANAEAAAGNPFAEAVFAVEGVQSLFGVNTFVTVTRKAGADWDVITAGVQKAAAEHL